MSSAYNVVENRNRGLFKDVVSPYELACLIRSSIDQFTSASVLVIAFLTMEAKDKYQMKKDEELTM